MKGSRNALVVAILLITLGTAWLLEIHHIGAPVSWPWPMLLTVIGALFLLVYGLNKITVVLGPFLIIGAVTNVLCQVNWMSVRSVIPSLVVAAGVLILLAYLLPLPLPEFMKDDNAAAPSDDPSAPPPSSRSDSPPRS
jgi:hypothetical protein